MRIDQTCSPYYKKRRSYLIKNYITNTYLKQARTAINQDEGTTQQEGKVCEEGTGEGGEVGKHTR